MSITVTFQCTGCFRTEPGTTILQRGCWSFTGREVPKRGVEDVAPEGWIAFDPYTGCTYCPECWAWIENGGDSAVKDPS